jgi:hypothetical protein
MHYMGTSSLERRANRRSQRSFYDPEVMLAERPLKPGSFPVRFRAVCDRVIPDAVFADLYSGIGRPPISPSVLMRLHLLMLRDGCGDEMAIENLRYDERWRYMCDLPLPECGIHPTTLHYFRLRLMFGTANRQEIARLKAQGIGLREAPVQRLFELTKQVGIELGLLDPTAAQYVDSTHILGAAAVQDTFRLLFQGLRQVVRAHGQAADAAAQQALLEALRRPEYTTAARKPQIDWRDAEARSALLTDLVQDAATLLTVCEGSDTPAVRDALAQLQRLVAQDVEVSEAGKAAIRQGVAPDRQISTVDPEMRHGRKSSRRRFDGYKTHLALEPESGLLTAVETTAGSLYDGDAVPAILEQTSPVVLGGDNAYAGPEQRAEALAQGTAILTPTAPLGPYAKDSFGLDEGQGMVTCPAGQRARIGKSGRAKFAAKVCSVCPMHEQCNPSGKGRTLTIGEHEALGRNLRAAARSERWSDFLRRRCVIEHRIAHFIRWAGRKGRYFGKLKTGLQMVLGAIGHNLDKLGRHCAWPTAAAR